MPRTYTRRNSVTTTQDTSEAPVSATGKRRGRPKSTATPVVRGTRGIKQMNVSVPVSSYYNWKHDASQRYNNMPLHEYVTRKLDGTLESVATEGNSVLSNIANANPTIAAAINILGVLSTIPSEQHKSVMKIVTNLSESSV
mgnify:CR=1 FL=1